MKRRIITSLQCLIAAVFLLGSATSALASYTATVTSPQTTYTAGANNTFVFNVTITTDGTAEFVDNIIFTFPAGVTVVSTLGAQPFAGCGSGAANASFAGTVATWATPGHPSGCGAFDGGTYALTVTVSVPGAFSGPMVVNAQTRGDGWPPPLTDPQISNFAITYAQLAPCAIVCPADILINLDPGACGQFVNYNVTTTGTCEVVSQACGFTGTFAPAEIDYWEQSPFGSTGAGIPPANNGGDGLPQIQFSDLGPACATNPDQLRISSAVVVGGYCYTGFEWDYTGTAPTQVSFNWAYQAGTNGAWDQFVTGIGTPAVGMGDANNNFCNNFTGYWTAHTPLLGPAAVAGVFMTTLNPGQTLSLAMHTQIAFGGGTPGFVIITNFQSLQIVPAPLVQISGLPSGSEFPIGTTTNCFAVDFPPFGVIGANDPQCCFDVEVIEFPNPITSLVCNDLVYVSLDESCSYCLGADGVLEGGPYKCYDDYVVQVDRTLPFGNGPWNPACFGPADIGKTYQVRVFDDLDGDGILDPNENKCWGNVKIEDKLPPVLECRDLVVPCNTPLSDIPNEPAPELIGHQVITYENIGDPIGEPGAPVPDIQVYNFDYSYLPVGTPVLDVNVRIKILGHTWLPDLNIVVEDPSGNQADVFTLTGCFGQEWPIDVLFDDEGLGNLTLCVQLDAGGAPLQSIVAPGVSSPTVLTNAFDGEEASGIWTVTISDNVGADDGVVECVGLEVEVNLPAIVPSDNCCFDDLTFIDVIEDQDCDDGFSHIIHRKWTATDCSGNTATCIQDISFELPTLGDVVCPPDYDDIDAEAFECGDFYSIPMPIINGHPNPTPEWIESQGLQGFPWVFGLPVGCSINWNYEDLVIVVCDGTVKYRREWTIIDWCIGDGFTCNQIIKVLDETGPVMTCPANLTVSTDPFTCCATTNLPDILIEDFCSRINNINAMVVTFDAFTNEQTGMYVFTGSLSSFPGNNFWDLDTMGVFGFTPCLPLGTHTVTYTAEDDCGNTSSCTFRLTVRDYVPPVAVCDEFTVVAIGIDDPFDCYGPAGPPGQGPEALGECDFAGVTWVKASTFDDGSYDNCNALHFTVQRMAPYSDCILGLNSTNGHPACDDVFPDFPSEFERAISEYDSIKFYCCEVGTSQLVIFRAYQLDINGNIAVGQDGTPIFNSCMVEIEVQDKLKPSCIPPAHVTVNCESFDPSLWVYGIPQLADNCCLDTTKVYQDQCGLTHTVSYTNFDTVCNRGTIIRTFRAFDCHGLSSQCTQRIVVTYEQDYFVKFPNDVIVTICDGTGNYGEPFFFGEDCELLGTSFEDEIFTVVPDACFKIERTWRVINWCTYNPNLPCIYVDNPNPQAAVNHPANLPGPTVSACGTLPPWAPTIVKINPSDPVATNYCVYYDANANCYEYKQIIKVIDTQDPIIADCPASPLEICDLSPNNPELWNEMYWWDNTIGLHDLCEAPTDLCITATDDCSGANIGIEYLLFLDLDGDGIMETVVNSTTLGIAGLGWNRVNYGNAQNPNFSGGTPRQFDERPVPANQKWGFAIQETISGVNKTACVRWNTQQSQNTFVVPELPYGTHKIKWFVTDGCGNEATCEYIFIVKDCKAPTVVCYNGLSVNIMPTGMITLWATDFLKETFDNCTPTGQIKIGIRKSGTGTGFPVDGNGNPITSVTFTCDELGTQPVELWAIDAAGNADYCETYVIVQDNFGNCGTNANIAGELKTESQEGLELAQVQLDGSSNAGPLPSMFEDSDNAGFYQFSNAIPLFGNYTVTPTAEDLAQLNGVTTYDLVLISKHILGLEPLNTPYKMIAADANKSGSITTFDIVELRKLILGIYDELPNNTSWRFVDKTFSFPNPANPFASSFPENKTVADVQADQMDDDFVSVKIGDVNLTATANSTMTADDRTAGTLLFDVQDRTVSAGEEFDVTFKGAEKVKGYQFTASLKGLSVVGITEGADIKSSNFGVFNDKGALTTSVDGEANEFTVRFRAAQSGRLSEMLGVSSRITRAEAYSLNGDRLSVAFRFGGTTISGVGFELYQNEPNPFVSKTFIGFHLPEASTATLSVYDESGRLVFTQKGEYAKGHNTVALDRALLSTTGVLYYTLETATDSATKKMIQSK